MSKRIQRETSPYLRQHGEDLVDWQPWDEQALEAARRENKPILLSIGYSACHWCHVMAEESFRDPQTATQMNTRFINILVDREERPDLDTLYQSSLAQLGHRRGWPLIMFLTPQGEPFGGGTYYPPEPGYGRPAFRDVLAAMAAAYANDPQEVLGQAQQLTAALARRRPDAGASEISAAFMNYVAQQLLGGIDIVYGGFGTQGPKFPQVMALELLWRAYYRTGETHYRDAVVLTAENICRGGIYDHVGGGIHRYAVDDAWLVPHFEKMLYDNALLLDLLTLLWQHDHQSLFAQQIEETVNWALREMKLPGGGFAATLAADSEGYDGADGGEGVFYLWTEDEIAAELGDEAPLFQRFYDLNYEANGQGRGLLIRSEHSTSADPALETQLARLRAALRAKREQRPRPGRDDKVLADWNGLMIAGLANAGAALERPAWITAAARAFAFVRNEMDIAGRLCHSFSDGCRRHPATLDDYAHMARAALCLFEATADASHLAQAQSWVATADRHYWDNEAGGYFLTADDAPTLITRMKIASETAAPAGNAVLVGVLARLYALTGHAAYRERADAIVAAFAAEAQGDFFGMASLINSSELLYETIQIVLVGVDVEPLRELRRAVFETCVLNRALMQPSPANELPAGNPAAGKIPVGGRATAYLCIGATCSPPITDPEALRTALLRG